MTRTARGGISRRSSSKTSQCVECLLQRLLCKLQVTDPNLSRSHSSFLKMTEAVENFSLKDVLADFKSCLGNDNQAVLMDYYLSGWKGLVKFMNSLGTIFTFVSKDAVAKIQIMEGYRNSAESDKYISLQSMVAYELAAKLVDLEKRSDHPNSGCRTILRLHRALRWLQLFLDRLKTSTAESKTSTMCTNAYNESLSNYHPWIIRKTATVAFCALPNRDAFFDVMNVGTSDEVMAMLNEAMPYVAEVYEITQQLYAQHNLLDLP
ncbi:ceramide-1-phosphate transfer protein isoform X2 [Pleurodeles waltl]|uniref:ceramide-1-phosphate transfer protein isoform X2 n=1 Tax=Pleurodeles waltl TaxID=8319 RepID=UPI0037095E32